MAIEIGLQRGGEINYQLSLDDDGYYWYLHPLFEELRNRTGIYIDLYGDASFSRGNISQLETLVQKARNRLKDGPEIFEVKTGNQTHPVKKVITEKVSKEILNKFLNSISDMIREVKKSDAKLVFIGD